MGINEIIAAKLDEVEQTNHIKILHAVESGSRAWGFASPDSDYDVRFIYVQPRDHYLKLEDTKDFINWELDEVLDINGWDLKKALKLFYKSNTTLFEWANSPIIYRTTEEWKDIYRKAASYFSKKASMYHYYGTAKSNYNQYLLDEYVNYKKYFYVIRPLLACKWIEEYGTPAPVLFEELKDSLKDKAIKEMINQLQAEKIKMREVDKGKRIDGINSYIAKELTRYETCISKMKDDRKGDWKELNQIFLKHLH